MDYEKDVLDDAVELLQNHEDDMKEAIVEDTDFSDICDEKISDWIHEEVTDRSYTLQDAAYILDNCENEKTDSGLWEGFDARDMMSAIAAYSYSADVWFKAEELYDALKVEYEDRIFGIEHITDADKTAFASDVFQEFEGEYTIDPIKTGGQEELDLLREFHRLQESAGMWDGYPLGSAYIDTRCGTGHGMPEIKDFVDFDHEIRYKLPHMQGMYKPDVDARIKELEAEESA